MDGDFQQNYQAAEHAYGEQEYETAHLLASQLLNRLDLEGQADDTETQDAVRGWRALVTLLLGHIELHGLHRPNQAARFYQLTLDCQPQETLAEIAQQGLERSQSAPEKTFNPNVDDPTSPAPTAKKSSAGSLPSMLQDPFLSNAPPRTTPGPSQQTAMPWLPDNNTTISAPQASKNNPSPAAQPTAEPVPSSQPTQQSAETEDMIIGMPADETPPCNNQPLPLFIPEESLQNALLRISIPQAKTRADSIPMDQAKPPSILERLSQGLRRS